MKGCESRSVNFIAVSDLQDRLAQKRVATRNSISAAVAPGVARD
jgi:hypothetical protein